jgi:hypothetical protein
VRVERALEVDLRDAMVERLFTEEDRAFKMR